MNKMYSMEYKETKIVPMFRILDDQDVFHGMQGDKIIPIFRILAEQV